MNNKILIFLTCILLALNGSITVLGAENTTNEFFKITKPNRVTVDSINLAIHTEKEGDFSPIYTYDNPFRGQDTSKGVTIEFTAQSTWEVNMLGTIFSIIGTGENDGRLYFTSGSYLGFNSGNYGGYFDANMKDYLLVQDYIDQQAAIKIELHPTGFNVYANGKLCYDQSILDDISRGSGDFKGSSDFTPVLDWLSKADTLNFGYGSWWNGVNADEAYIELSDVSFKLSDGTVLFDQLVVDQTLVDQATEVTKSISAMSKVSTTIPEYTGDLTSVLIDSNNVEYNGFSIIPIVIFTVVLVFITSGIIIIRVLNIRGLRNYSGNRRKLNR